MYLFILESIGTSELILIGMVALIVFGPRKLPQIARTIGKTMADFRKTTNDFKSTWEKEVSSIEKEFNVNEIPVNDPKPNNTIERENKQITAESSIMSPEIKELSSAEVEKFLDSNEKKVEQLATEPAKNDKRSWL
ncbi:MAG: twin-arginine translocase TatA/TatE family subunit [Pyrinomonadaceae bacterium]